MVCGVVAMAAVASFSQILDGNRGRFGVGYEEGLAARFFFLENMGAQLSVGFEHLGGYDGPRPTPGDVESATDVSVMGGFIFTILGTKYVYVDAVGMLGFAHDGTRDPDDIDDRNWVFFRAALAPELLLGDHLGLGFRCGFEMAYMSDTKADDAGTIIDTQDDRFNVRFYGPQNPFSGSLLGVSLYVYFGSFGRSSSYGGSGSDYGTESAPPAPDIGF
jgi:hypothetical protein